MLAGMNSNALYPVVMRAGEQQRRPVQTGGIGDGVRDAASRRCPCLLVMALTAMLSPALHAAAEPAADDDGAVLAACLAAIHPQAHAQTPAPPLHTIHVMPRGERSTAGLDKQQLARTFPGMDWSRANPAIDAIHRRSGEQWNPPARLPAIDVPVQVKEPPRSRRWFQTQFFVAFWPPGYSDDGDYAVVLATFGPSDHGSIAGCQLQREGDSGWTVSSQRVLSWL